VYFYTDNVVINRSISFWLLVNHRLHGNDFSASVFLGRYGAIKIVL